MAFSLNVFEAIFASDGLFFQLLRHGEEEGEKTTNQYQQSAAVMEMVGNFLTRVTQARPS